MAPWLAALAVLQLSPPVLPAGASSAHRASAPVRSSALPAALDLASEDAARLVARRGATEAGDGAREHGRGVSPTCAGDVCAPRVAVPGFEPRFDKRGKRTELVLLALDRAHVEPLATIVWALAATGLRLDYTPPQLESGLESGRAGWGHVQLLLRWRIDATNAPVWPVRR